MGNEEDSVFISYSHKDSDIVRTLVKAQDDLAYAAYIDIEDTPPGANWLDHHSNTIRGADRFILCWSKNTAQSPHVEREWQLALRANVKIIPVFLDNTLLPKELQHIHAISLHDYLHQLALPGPPLNLTSGYGFGAIGAGVGIFFVMLLTYTWLPLWFLIILFMVDFLLIIKGIQIVRWWQRWSRLVEKINRSVIKELKNWQ